MWILAASGGGINPLQINTGLIFWTLVTFVLLLIVLYLTAWKPIIRALDSRADKIQGDIDQANQDREEAEKLLAARKAELDEQLSKAQEIIAEGKKDAEALKEDIVARANSEAEDIKDRTKREIELAKQKALSEIQNTVLDLSVSIAGKIIDKELDAQTHKALVEKSLAESKTGLN